MTIPAGFEAAIVAAEAERHGCDVVPDVTSRQVKGHRGLFTSYLVRTTTLYVNGRLCLLKRAKVPADTPEGARRYAHFDFRTNRFKDKEFVVLRIECGDSSSFYILTMSELLEWYGEDAARISLGIPVPEYPIAYCHAGFDWAACKNAWHIIRPLS
ncbi:hypothetical protein K8R03_00110 [Candidatus Kaiserbacteria bacterium]|nr:hypothetical protein [Candidatus Kaiserbacteria bacterium]